jgi:hypothetical protein
MKETLTGALLIVLILGCSFHFSIVYLNYIRTLGIGIMPGVSVLLKPDLNTPRKDVFRVK